MPTTSSQLSKSSSPSVVDDPRWARIAARDKTAVGQFWYSVSTTGVYCRPSCASRRPKPENLRYYPLPEAAERAGFRPCKRCRPRAVEAPDPQAAAVRRACAAIEAHLAEGDEGPPKLQALAEAAGVSPWHLQRTFSRLLGVSPRAYADALRLDRLKRGLKQPNGHGGVAGAVYEAGYGSGSRVYERAGAELGMTPATYAKGGRGASITYAVAISPLGRLLVASTDKGVCRVSLGDSVAALERELKADFPEASLRRDDEALHKLVENCLQRVAGAKPHKSLPLDIQATAFQRRVWQELQSIPVGETRSYREIAAAIGRPEAARAVGRACASNPVGLVIPCHRAIREDGSLGGYRWGLKRKEALLETERTARAGRR